MAHKGTAAAPSMPKEEPRAHISWPKEGVRLSGDYEALAMGKRARILLEGEITGFSMADYGCSVDLKLRTVRVDGVADRGADDDGPSLVAMVANMKPEKRKKE